MSVFCLEGNKYGKPEHYDISSSDSDGGVLLLISSIIQSNIGSGLNFTEFLTLLTGDFKDNGTIDDSILQKTLGTSGLVLDIQEIRNNLISRYSELGQTINPCIGRQFLSEFNRLNPYPTVFDGTFPNTTGDFINLVGNGDTVSIDHNHSYAIAINGKIDSDISNMLIRITSTSDNFSTTGIDWFYEGDKRIYLLEYDASDMIIPIEFMEPGSLELELSIVLHSSGMVEYPKIFVKWT